MANEITSYQCPNCNGPLKFDADSQKLLCESCGSSFDIEQIDQYYQEKNQQALGLDDKALQQQAATVLQFSDSEKENLRAYNCSSCGAQLITDNTTAATSCPYCGNPQIVPAQLSDSYKPEYIIPFKYDKKDAIAHLKQFYKGKPLLPKEFKDENHIDEIKGVYVPFWTYDGTCYGHLRAHGTRVHSHRSGDFMVTETNHYLIIRDGKVVFENIPADASSKMNDDFMDSIEPYDFKEMVPFSMSYLVGYFADRYDVDYKQDQPRIDLRMKNSTISCLNSTINGYTSVLPENSNVKTKVDYIKYLMLPVWVLSTTYKNKTYMFMSNGQTGKFVGDDLPIDKLKAFLYFIAITIALLIINLIIFKMSGEI